MLPITMSRQEEIYQLRESLRALERQRTRRDTGTEEVMEREKTALPPASQRGLSKEKKPSETRARPGMSCFLIDIGI